MTMNTVTVAILGPGGVGGLIGALLARDGHRVVCLAGEETTAVLRREGPASAEHAIRRLHHSGRS